MLDLEKFAMTERTLEGTLGRLKWHYYIHMTYDF